MWLLVRAPGQWGNMGQSGQTQGDTIRWVSSPPFGAPPQALSDQGNPTPQWLGPNSQGEQRVLVGHIFPQVGRGAAALSLLVSMGIRVAYSKAHIDLSSPRG